MRPTSKGEGVLKPRKKKGAGRGDLKRDLERERTGTAAKKKGGNSLGESAMRELWKTRSFSRIGGGADVGEKTQGDDCSQKEVQEDH